MKKNKYIGVMMMAAALLLATSCSDFDDYNKEVTDATASANLTLWENIRQNAQLSDFASLVEKAGYADELDATHYYTVWAPANGTFDLSAYESLDDKALLRQFVQNHIADFSYNATGKIDQRVTMLNTKSYSFTGSGSYVFDGQDVTTANLPSNNGVLHILNGAAQFYPNIYEFVKDTVVAAQWGIDSLSSYIRNYEQTYLDENASVLGSIVDGMQTYVDSVIVTENTLWRTLSFKMENEDSTYTFLMPTNRAWNATYDKLKSNFNYIASTNAQIPITEGGSTTMKTAPTPYNVDAAYMKDSLARRYLTRYLAYSNNDAYNRWLTGTPSAFGSDTLRTTNRLKLSNPRDILAQTIAQVEMSNGKGYIIDSLAIMPWETYNTIGYGLAYNNNYVALVTGGGDRTITVNDPDPSKIDLKATIDPNDTPSSSFRYIHITPSNASLGRPELTLYLPNVLSTTYNIYCIVVPENVSLADSNVVQLPNRLKFTLNYCDAAGTLRDQVFLDDRAENVSGFRSVFKTVADNATNRELLRAFENDPTKVDTLFVGEFTFPVCYHGMGFDYCPNIKITTPAIPATLVARTAKPNFNDVYTRDLRIAEVILVPKEFDEYRKSNK